MLKDGRVWLSNGGHNKRESGVCAMEYVAYLAGERHSAAPKCVSVLLVDFFICLNDSARSDEERQKLRPYLTRCIGTRTDGQDGDRRELLFKWVAGTVIPEILELIGHRAEANTLRASEKEGYPGSTLNEVEAAIGFVVRVRGHRLNTSHTDHIYGGSTSAAQESVYFVDDGRSSTLARILDKADTNFINMIVNESDPRKLNDLRAKKESALDRIDSTVYKLLDEVVDPGGIHDVKEEIELLALLEDPIPVEALARALAKAQAKALA